jgi:hypothetical protein
MGSQPTRNTGVVRRVGTGVVAALLATFLGGAGIAGAQSSGQTSSIDVTVTLTSKQTVLTQVGKGGDITYGWNQLTGSADQPAGKTDVELLGNVDYLNGSGRFFGFMTMKFASLSTLGFLVEGRATKQANGSTKLKAALNVIEGNAAFTGAKGAGSFTGTRAAALGSPIEITIKAKLRLR